MQSPEETRVKNSTNRSEKSDAPNRADNVSRLKNILGRLRSKKDRSDRPPVVREKNDGTSGHPVGIVGEEGKLGRLYDSEGDNIRLSVLCDSKKYGDSEYADAYFSTESGNIWRINPRDGVLTDSSRSQSEGILKTYRIPDSQIEDTKLSIGNKLLFDNGRGGIGQTGRVKEILGVFKDESLDYARFYERGGPDSTTIVQEFKQKMTNVKK